jgi:opacity protein-like surface antigen
MKLFKPIIFVAASMLSFIAQAENNGHYIIVSSGIANSTKPKGDFEYNSLGSGKIYSIALGHQFTDNFRADISLDYKPDFVNEYNMSNADGSFTSRIGVKSYTSMVNLYYDFFNKKGFTPYATLGIGAASNKTINAQETLKEEETEFPLSRNYQNKNIISFAWKIGLGTRYVLSEMLEIDFRYQFSDLGKFRTSSLVNSYYDGKLANSEYSSLHGNIKSHDFLLGIMYKF